MALDVDDFREREAPEVDGPRWEMSGVASLPEWVEQLAEEVQTFLGMALRRYRKYIDVSYPRVVEAEERAWLASVRIFPGTPAKIGLAILNDIRKIMNTLCKRYNCRYKLDTVITRSYREININVWLGYGLED